MAVKGTNPVKIAIIDGAPIEASESDSEDFTYQVDEVGDDFDDGHKGEDIVFSCNRQATSTHLFVARCAISQLTEIDDWRKTVIFHTYRRQ